MKMSALFRRLRDERGIAAVEFALIAPVIALLAATSFAIWEFADSRQDMRSALKVGAEYYLNGGSDDATAATLAVGDWRHKPAGAYITTSRSCRCGETAITCTSLCPASRPPAVYVTLSASAPLEGGGNPTVDRMVVRVR
ncbi:TadE/TadG family type IV pilus assembly protein [Phenylobacterium sp.]|uniref:TadE/TadG family type IV pilus assembly protein n=1 Tax=Phenylobacterium sp. TaxID=1871053 RepID=UPI002733C7D4|nr:TadE/TadG family type IV pilus assembly protein [Phenylobacterium sp.]MDP3854286.1 pilus assembly protein [Phenylobacterium sp.]